MLTVVSAILESDGKLLVCQRRRSGAFPLKWEFPGGKVNPGETPASALVRELREELAIGCSIGAEIYRTRHVYAELKGEIELIFFAAKILVTGVRNLAFEQIQWLEPQRLPELDFLPADRELVEKLACGSLRAR